MATEILMPALTPTMEEGTLANWLVEPGDAVERGQIIAEIETDKSILEFEALEGGIIGELCVDAGTEGVSVDTVIAILLEPGEETPTRRAGASHESDQRVSQEASSGASGDSASPSARRKRSGRVPSSPAARRVAKENGIDIERVEGTGPRGRILKGDVERAVAAGERAAPEAVDETEAEVGQTAFNEERLTTALRTMGRRMAESKRTIPHLYCSVDICADALLAMREELTGDDTRTRVTINDLITFATARALQDTPRMNVQYVDGRLRRFDRVDLSVAVALEDGLITPVIRSADTKSLARVAAETRELAERAKQGRLRPEEYEGGTFTVSNVGMFGIDQSWPIINPPQAGILGVGRAAARAVPSGDEIIAATMMSVTLSADHRVIDGAIAGAFLRSLKEYIERPARLLL